MAVPLADPITIFMGGMLGVYFTRDLWFTIYVFLVQHYLILWAVLEMYTMSDTMQYRFIWNMALFYFLGCITGLFLTWMLGNRVAVPTHLFYRQRLKAGALFVTLGITWAPRSLVIALDLYDPNDNLDDDPSKPAYWAYFSVWLVIAIFALIITAIQRESFPSLLKAFALIRYDDEKKIFRDNTSGVTVQAIHERNRLITGNVVWLMLLLGAQAIWDFAFPAGVGPADDKARFALWGALTIIFEAAIWWIFYAIYRFAVRGPAAAYFRLDKWPGTWDRDEITRNPLKTPYSGLFLFTLVGFLAQILSGIGFLIYGLVHDQTDIMDSVTPLVAIGVTIAVIAGIFIIVHWVMYDRKSDSSSVPLESEIRLTRGSKYIHAA